MFSKEILQKVQKNIWEIPKSYREDMCVPARVFASERMLDDITTDRSLEQLVNVSTLPGIQEFAISMPDIHEGYGFPIGGVAALSVEDGVISPGGVGYDINCGVRLLKSKKTVKDIESSIVDLANQVQRDTPSGVGRGGELVLSQDEMDELLEGGVPWIIKKGYGLEGDEEFLEQGGRFDEADSSLITDHAKKRGRDQVGTLGAGNHFVEVQKVHEVLDDEIAQTFGLFKDQIVVMIHTGSRGLGHQVCTDYLRVMVQAMAKYDITLPDRELASVPFLSKEGQEYFKAMNAAANFGFCNRQVLTHLVRGSWKQIIDKKEDLSILYDVGHNMAKRETHDGKEVVVHRKGATRAFGPGHPEIPKQYQSVGQPVIIPGSMGTFSYVLAGTNESMKQSFGSTCHGAGRRMSRKKAKKVIDYNKLKQELDEYHVVARAGSARGLVEEAPGAYKDIDDVVNVVQETGIAKKVVKLKPLVVVKG